MADVSGPTSKLPGNILFPPEGMMCDDHQDRLAVKRVVGEVDSFGAEYIDMCDACYAEYKENLKTEDTSGKCDWCGTHVQKRRHRRDYEEGLAGRVYEVCDACITRENKRLLEELNDLDDRYFD